MGRNNVNIKIMSLSLSEDDTKSIEIMFQSQLWFTFYLTILFRGSLITFALYCTMNLVFCKKLGWQHNDYVTFLGYNDKKINLFNTMQRHQTRKFNPQRRTNLTNLILFGIAFGDVILDAAYGQNGFFSNLIYAVTGAILFLFLSEFLFRFCSFFEEYRHLGVHYDDFPTLFHELYYFPITIWVLVVLSLCIHFYEGLLLQRLSRIVFLTAVEPLHQFFQCGHLYANLFLENSQGLDCGSGMAHSFFHGYLKLIIPQTGTTEPHLRELMDNYEATHNIRIACKKIFILIPKSLYCPVSLKNDAHPSIEESASLRPIVKTVAGVQNRIYKNSVYKINDGNGRRVYVCAEYATPLKTFNEVVQNESLHRDNYRRHKNAIIFNFYRTLKMLVDAHDEFRDSCELVFYNDKTDRGEPRDVGAILLRRIERLTTAN